MWEEPNDPNKKPLTLFRSLHFNQNEKDPVNQVLFPGGKRESRCEKRLFLFLILVNFGLALPPAGPRGCALRLDTA